MNNTDKIQDSRPFVMHRPYSDENSKQIAPFFMGDCDYNTLTYLHKEHTKLLTKAYLREHQSDNELNEEKLQPKAWQDAILTAFIDQKLPKDAAMLEVGGGFSRILYKYHHTHKCWNLDKFEGVGAGPKSIPTLPYPIVQDYIGSFNKHIPDNYFDLVFSISVLEHIPYEKELYKNILADMQRMLKPGGYCVHCIDFPLVSIDDSRPLNYAPFTQYFFDNVQTLNTFVPTEEAINKHGALQYTTQTAYDASWLRINNQSYEQHGPPSSIQVFWQKA